MSRLEPAEPSMEEILASIRKIIAEDPPGSRALPESPPQPSASVSKPGFPRLDSFRPGVEAKETLSHSNEPTLGHEPLLPQPAAAPQAKSAPAEPFDLDAQMAEVLSKVRAAQAAIAVETGVMPPPTEREEEKSDLAVPALVRDTANAKPAVQAALDSLLPEPLAPAPAAIEPAPVAVAPAARPGFTVARDGYIPQEVEPPTSHDPFEFSLGPSPFASRSASERKSALQEELRAPEPVSIPAAAEAAVEEAAIVAEAPQSAVPVIAEPAKAEPAAPIFSPIEAVPETAVAEPVPVAEPAATAGPEITIAVAEVAVPAPLQVPEPAPVPEATAAPAASDVKISDLLATTQIATTQHTGPVVEAATVAIEAAVSEPAVERYEPIEAEATELVPEIEPAPIRNELPEAFPVSAALPARSFAHQLPAAQQRSMEDTVAELLRPMLRNWLAENMPRIVESALRKELDESLQSEHKSAAE